VQFDPVLTVVAAGLTSVATQGVKIVTDTILQVHCEDDYRGRVFSLNDTAINLCFVSGLFLAAVTLPADGHSVGMMLGVAGAYAAIAAWYGVFTQRSARSPALPPRSP
jgi:hypothetical protein